MFAQFKCLCSSVCECSVSYSYVAYNGWFDMVLVNMYIVDFSAASDILLRQSCARILVGDPNQQIYGFRGARNAMRDVESTHTFYLTQVSCAN